MLPLPAGAKWPPPRGYTGWAGREPSGADIQAWVDGPEAAGNIGLHLPTGVYGLDVDDYNGKTGATALERLVEGYGPLPATWIVSSREESASGIRLFRAELLVGRRWRDEPAGHGAGIEAIHRGHRYAVAWPSTHPDTGRKYGWRRPDGIPAGDGELPRAAELPELPAAWVEGLSELGEVRTGDMAGHDETVGVVTAWREGAGVPCPRVVQAHERGLGGLSAGAAGAALHPAALAAVHELTNLGNEGHAGVRAALAEHNNLFVEVRGGRAAAGDGRRDAEAEWWRMVRGAVGKLPRGAGRAVCDCDLWSGATVQFDWAPPVPAEGEPLAEGEPAEEVLDGWAAAVQREVMRLRLRDEAAEIHAGEQHARRWTEPVSHGDLATELLLPDDAPQWRVHGLLGNGHNAVLVAGRKTGKTTLVNEFIRSYVDGGLFLGAQPMVTTGAAIAVFNYEVDQAQYRRWLREVGVYNAHLVYVLHLRGKSLPLADARVRRWVVTWLRDRRVGAWVLDPYSRAYIGSLDNGNDEAQVSAFLDGLDVVKAEAGVSELVMPVHTPKARVEAGDESAIGSQRLEGWPDVMWYLTRDAEGRRYLRAEGRDIEVRETQLNYDASTRRLILDNFGQDRKTVRRNAKLERLIAFIHHNPECTTNQIRDSLGLSSAAVVELVAASAGRIVTEDGPNRARRHLLREDQTGGTESFIPLPLGSVPPFPLVGGTPPYRGVTPPLDGDVGTIPPPNPFDLDSSDLEDDDLEGLS